MRKKLLWITVLSFIFLFIGISVDFCARIASLMILFLVVEDLLEEWRKCFWQILVTYIISTGLCIISTIMDNNLKLLILHMFFSLLLLLKAIWNEMKLRQNSKME